LTAALLEFLADALSSIPEDDGPLREMQSREGGEMNDLEAYGDGTVSDPLSGPQTVELRDGLEWGKEKLEKLELAPLKAKHLRGFDGSQGMTTDLLLGLAGQLSGKQDRALDLLSMHDLSLLLGTIVRMLWPVGNLPKPKAGEAVAEAPETPWALELETEITKGSDTITRLEFRALRTGDVRKLNLDHIPIGSLIPMIEKLTGANRRLVDELEGVDLFRALEAITLFFLDFHRATTAP